MSVVLIAIGSAIVIASKAMPTAANANDTVVATAKITEKIAADLCSAVYLTERTANAVTFTLADRGTDGLPEVIRYAWSGTPGDPLTRKVNGGTAVNVLENVQQFNLTFDTENRIEQYPGPIVESPKTELISYSSGSGLDLGNAHVHGTPFAKKSWSQYFKPTFSAGTTAWSITRVKVFAKDDNENVSTTVELQLPDVNLLPSGNVVDSSTLHHNQTNLSYQWVEETFNNAVGLSPTAGLCLTFSSALNRSVQLQYRKLNVSFPNVGLSKGTPAWGSLATDQSLWFYVYGTTSAPAPQQAATRAHVTSERITLGVDVTETVETSVRMLNRPEALTAVWDADFNADPTLMDLDLDGTMDWATTGSFNPAHLNNGQWYVDGTLNTNPNNTFNELTTVDARLRDEAPSNGAGGIKIRVDRIGNTYCYIKAEIEMQPDNTQTLIVESHDPALTLVPIVTETGLPDEYIDLRIMIDPVLDMINVQINGQDRGTFQYGRATIPATPHTIEVYETATFSFVRFDRLRVRLGGNGTP